MAVPEEGPLHLGKIAKEFVYDNYDSTSTQPTNVSLKNLSTHAADGGFDAVNTASFHKPDGSVEHSMGEFYEYDHDFSTNPLYVTYTLRYSSSTSTVCEASTVTVDADWFQDYYKTDPVEAGLDIYEDTSSSLNGAAQGWYSNGTEKRYWTGNSWYGIQNCGSSSNPNSTTNEAFTLDDWPYQPYNSDWQHVRQLQNVSGTLIAKGKSLTDKYYRFNLRYNSVGDHSLIVDSNENVYTGGGLYNSDDKNFKPAIGLRDKYGSGNIFSCKLQPPDSDMWEKAEMGHIVWNWGEGISNVISDMCWIDNNGTPTHIFWVDCDPGNTSLVPIGTEYFRFGAVKNATQTKSSITYPELFQFEHFTKVLEKNPIQQAPIWFPSRYTKPSVASTYSSGSICYVAGQVYNWNSGGGYQPFIYRLSYTNQTAAAGTSSNIWSSGQFRVWEEGDGTFKNMFRDIDANSTQVVAVGSKQSEGIAVITNTGSTYSKHLHFGGTHTIANGVKVSGSNIYICGITGTSAGTSQYKAFLIKTNGSTLTWKKIYKLNLFGTGEDADSYVWKQITIDSSDNIYVATQQEFRKTSDVPDDIYFEGGHFDQKDHQDSLVNTATDDFRIAIAKFNSSGTLQWIKRININPSTQNNWPDYTKCKGISSLYVQGDYLYAGFSYNYDKGQNAGHDYFKIKASDGDISTGSLGFGFSVTAATMSSGTALNTYTDYSSDSFSFTAYTNGSGNWNTVAQNAVLQLSATGGDISDASFDQQWGYYGGRQKVS
jgi:hypothetical protein